MARKEKPYLELENRLTLKYVLHILKHLCSQVKQVTQQSKVVLNLDHQIDFPH